MLSPGGICSKLIDDINEGTAQAPPSKSYFSIPVKLQRCFSQLFLASIAIIVLYKLSDTTLTGVEAGIPDNKYLIGVHPERKHLYELTSGQSFKCIDGSATIPIESVNDDYCDCSDASDEPGTSACIHGQFFCSNVGYMQKLIPSAWVNDGQCDCCDATDEYNSSIKCENTCGVLGEQYRAEQARYQEIANQGSAIRSQYKEEARQRKEQNSQLLEQYRRELNEKENAIRKLEEEINSDFGPANVFFPLKGKCFSYQDREYTYTLCPFERATQESTTGMQTELGRWSGWAGPPENLYSRQKYEGGIQCWNGPTRSAVINIACGVEDKVTMVTEPSKCEYVYDFITPAACPDTDPPEQTDASVTNAPPSDQEQDVHPSRSDVEDEQGEQYEDHHATGGDEQQHDEL